MPSLAAFTDRMPRSTSKPPADPFAAPTVALAQQPLRSTAGLALLLIWPVVSYSTANLSPTTGMVSTLWTLAMLLAFAHGRTATRTVRLTFQPTALEVTARTGWFSRSRTVSIALDRLKTTHEASGNAGDRFHRLTLHPWHGEPVHLKALRCSEQQLMDLQDHINAVQHRVHQRLGTRQREIPQSLQQLRDTPNDPNP